jgi:ribose transport system permease protein
MAHFENTNTKSAIDIGGPVGRALKNEFALIWFGTIALFAISAIVAPGTIRTSSISLMLPFAGILAIVSAGQTIVIQQRGLDMSLAGMMTIAGLMLTKLTVETGTLWVAIPVTLMFAYGFGVLNGLLVSRMNITPIVATLATNAILLGAVRTLSGGSPMTAPTVLSQFSHIEFLGLPMTVILAIAFILSISVITKRTGFGRRFVAVGANPATAAAAGLPVLRYQIATYGIAAVCFAVAGILFAGFIGTASQNAGNEYLLPAIAAVVVGGTPFTGGRGSVVASGVAALFMVQLGQMVLALGAGTAVQLLVQATAIVAAVLLRHVADVMAIMRGR